MLYHCLAVVKLETHGTLQEVDLPPIILDDHEHKIKSAPDACRAVRALLQSVITAPAAIKVTADRLPHEPRDILVHGIHGYEHFYG